MLTGVASTWFQGIKKSITDCKSAMGALKNFYDQRELFVTEHDEITTTDIFVSRPSYALEAVLSQRENVDERTTKTLRKRLQTNNHRDCQVCDVTVDLSVGGATDVYTNNKHILIENNQVCTSQVAKT
ncbi:hypothetical protein FQR65_LT10616 [Abscondita terminalis]|nr:hypothetical protein FQR65_LT10616 [Abscondita terminalis]